MILETLLWIFFGVVSIPLDLLGVLEVPIEWATDMFQFLSNHVLIYAFYFIDGKMFIGVLYAFIGVYSFVYGWGMMRILIGWIRGSG